MGDTGALFLGYMLAALSIEGFFKSYAATTLIIPLIVLGLPLFDTSFAIIRRIAGGRGIMVADRSHMHHRLIDVGFNQRQAVGILASISALLSLAAIILVIKNVNRMLMLLAASTLFFYAGRFYIRNRNIEAEFADELKKRDAEAEHAFGKASETEVKKVEEQ
jgi:UDP-GlcNAc:undecaprenyl-phosphate GlcNAc-1-phosphate transferase